MHEQFWRERWELNQIGFHEKTFNSHLQTFWHELSAPENGHVFVPLCGKTLDLLWLRSQGHQVTGVELSPIAVRDFFAENQLTPTVTQQGKFERWETDGLVILLGNFFDLSREDVASCTAVYDRASLIALPSDMRLDYVRHCASILPAWISTLLITLYYPQEEMDGPPFSVAPGEIEKHFAATKRIRHILKKDILAELPNFRQRGASQLHEHVFVLEPVHPA